MEIEQIEFVMQVQAEMTKDTLAAHLSRKAGNKVKFNEYKRSAANYAQACMNDVAQGDTMEFADHFRRLNDYVEAYKTKK